MMYLDQSLLRLCQTYKNILEKVRAGSADSVLSHNISISKYNH